MEATGSGTTAGDLRELVETLAKQRLLVAAAKVDAEGAETAAQATPEWAAWVNSEKALTDIKTMAKDLENQVRAQALEIGRRDGTKEPAPGVHVIRRTIFAVLDNLKAAEWAMKWAPLALRVDEKILAKQVMDVPADRRPEVPGVAITEEEYGTVKIDTDLAPLYLVSPD